VIITLLVALASSGALQAPVGLKVGPWRASLASPGGALPFTIEIEDEKGALHAVLVNGTERIAVPSLTIAGDEVTFDITHYDASLRAKISADGTSLSGEWSKRAGPDRRAKLPFTATFGDATRFASLGGGASRAGDVDGRWSVRFWSEKDPAVGIFHAAQDGSVEGTFLTTTGDYRYLAGSIDGDRLRLSCFDGAHAFLFDARLLEDGRLEGDFWSGDRWHDRWRATRDPKAVLPDTFSGVKAADDFGLALLHFPDLDGKLRSLAEFQFAGRALVLQVLGSWCPNCHDETAYLADLDRRYRARGLSIVGLAFEYSGEFARDAAQVRRMRDRHRAEYPFLLAGSAAKDRAAEALPALDRVLAFPTTIFLHRDGRVRAVHSGFAGPGTGAENAALRAEFESIVEEMLAETNSDESSTWSLLSGGTWRDTNDRSAHELTYGERVAALGTSVRIGEEFWYLDSRAGALLDARDFGHRLIRSETPLPQPTKELSALTLAENRRTALALESSDAFVRREALFSLADLAGAPEIVADMHPERFLVDADPLVRCTAAWTSGRCGARQAGPALISALQHGHAPLRREAARALGLLKVADAAERLRALTNDIDPLVRDAARAALQRAGTR
jgi:thiol-disulfide isomerase/thioredoxin